MYKLFSNIEKPKNIPTILELTIFIITPVVLQIFLPVVILKTISATILSTFIIYNTFSNKLHISTKYQNSLANIKNPKIQKLEFKKKLENLQKNLAENIKIYNKKIKAKFEI